MSDLTTAQPDKAPFSDGSGFTPGPWRVEEFPAPSPHGADRYIRSDARHWAVGVVYEMHGCTDPEMDITQPEALANARLVAAAPEMFEALDEVAAAFSEGVAWTEDQRKAYESVRAALAKALPPRSARHG